MKHTKKTAQVENADDLFSNPLFHETYRIGSSAHDAYCEIVLNEYHMNPYKLQELLAATIPADCFMYLEIGKNKCATMVHGGYI